MQSPTYRLRRKPSRPPGREHTYLENPNRPRRGQISDGIKERILDEAKGGAEVVQIGQQDRDEIDGFGGGVAVEFGDDELF